jgi:Transport and Golgi organisation 2
MCTVSIVPFDDGFRLVCNRDERLDRPEAIPPTVRLLLRVSATYPQDTREGGTWVGVNEAGLAASLLNRSAGPIAASQRRPPRSRGVIIPQLLNSRSLTEALETALSLTAAQFNPFRVVLVERMTAGIVTSDGVALSAETMNVERPQMLTSSGLGDAVVEAPRRQLFERLVLGAHEHLWPQAQDRFHAHQWPSRADISVLMERSDARTVSRTTIVVTSRVINLDYMPVGANQQAGRAA